MNTFNSDEAMTDQQLIELLAQREGGLTFKPHSHEPEKCAFCFLDQSAHINKTICPVRRYLFSLDALQPILATLTEEEWLKLDDEIGELFQEGMHPLKAIITLKPSQLARCIGKVIGNRQTNNL